MSDDRRRRTRELFDQVLDLPQEKRDGFLKEACGADRVLEEDVRSLIEAHLQAESFMASGQVAQALADVTSVDQDPLIGAAVGDYTVLGLLGRGGMGTVFRAEQEHPRREVALKLIDRGITTPVLLKRFEVEAQVLARLKHPGIAQIHVAGTTSAEQGGRPYFAMELVDGLPLTSFAADGSLGVPERLELLIKICEAVQYAHQVGVIHRDLKPANILVTAEGQPKILDFGIARSTDTDLQVTTVEGGQALLLGTLPYMSPEQVRGNPDELDTRADVHALGVLCFELLTGSLPRDITGKTLTDAIRTIDGEEPRKLGDAAGKRFPADLETIVAKALEGDKHRRYDSASGFAEDLRRYLDGQPISARPQSAVYQLRKLIVRNRLPAVLLAGLVLIALVSAILLGFQNSRTAEERDRANLEATTANQVSLFLENLFMEVNPEMALGEELTAIDILERGVERIGTELQDQPAVRGRVLATLGQVYGGLGQAERAERLLLEAVEIGRILQAEQEDIADRSNFTMALNLLSGHYTNQGRSDEAIALCREALELSGKVNGTESSQYATSLNHLAYQLAMVGASDEARELIEQGLDLRVRLLGPEHEDVGWSVYQYAWLLRSQGDLEGAREKFGRALAIWEKTLPLNHPQLGRCLQDYSSLLSQAGDQEAALEMAERALVIHRETLGEEHPALAGMLRDMANQHWAMGNLVVARRYFAEAVEAHQAALGPADPGMLTRLYELGNMTNLLNQPEAAGAVYERALDLARTHHGDQPAQLGEALARLGYTYAVDQERGEDANQLFRKAVEILEQSGAQHLHDLTTVRETLARVLSLEGQPEEALSLYRQVLAQRLEHPDWTNLNPILIRKHIGLNLLCLGRIEEADSVFRELLSETEGSPGVHPFFPANLQWLLGHCLYRSGATGEAKALYDSVLQVDPASLEKAAFWLRLRKAEDHAVNGRMGEAINEFRAAREGDITPYNCKVALLVNPRLDDDQRRQLLLAIAPDPHLPLE